MTVGEQLGTGGFGVVHEATLEGIDLVFAVKFLDPHPANEDRDGAKKRFFREAELLFRFRHPNITAIYGVGEHEDRPYILMEYFDGFNLAEARKGHGVPDPILVLPFIEAIASALDYAHRLNVVHRDIKPSNLMTKKGDARVLDFGVAALLDPEGERFTRTSDAVPGDAFSAPELADEPKLIDPRSDIYSLGACWYWLFTGTTPRGVNWEANIRSVPNMTPAYERVLLRCLEQKERRYQSAADLIADVRKLRLGEQPELRPGDLSDEEVRVLGAVVTDCPTRLDNISHYRLTQHIGARQTGLRTNTATTSLLTKELISDSKEHDEYSREDFIAYQPTSAGRAWVEKHIARVEELLRPIAADPPASRDVDIPF